MSERQTCPRRMREMGPWERREDLDTWLPGEVTRCSFCGSMAPDEFMEAVRAGREVGPTDKTYKAYLRTDNPGSMVKFYYMHLSSDQKREFVDLYNDGTMKISTPGNFYTMPFFMVPAPPEESSA